jgi:2-polyprenyl-3-methyl-5-hydroxy-6-metoxy-1,4-benzoquinol methylase
MHTPVDAAPQAAEDAWAGQPPSSLDQLDLHRAFAQYRRDYTRALPVDREAAILDFGCGWGSLLAYLARSGYRNSSGVDVDLRCVEFCKQHVKQAVAHAPDARGFLAERRAAYHAIFMRHVINYFPPEDLTAYLQAAHGALKPGGRLIVQVYNGALFTGAYPCFNDHHLRTVFTEHSLRWALEGAGFRVRSLFGAGGVGQTPKYRVWQAGHGLWSIVLRAPVSVQLPLQETPRRACPRSANALQQRHD